MAFVKARTGFGRLSSSQALLFEPSGAGFAWTRSGAGSSLDAALSFFPHLSESFTQSRRAEGRCETGNRKRRRTISTRSRAEAANDPG